MSGQLREAIILAVLVPDLFAVLVLFAFVSGVYAAGLKCRLQTDDKRRAILKELGILGAITDKTFVGLFHPYCNAGGGGERVLWAAVEHFQKTAPNIVSVVYTGDTDASKEDIVDKVKARFGISLRSDTLHLAYLKSRHLVEDKAWPRFTLLGQSLGSMVLGYEAMKQLIPDVYIDTMGYAFTFHVVRAIAPSSTPIGAYVHYPTISTDMLNRVRDRKAGHTNTGGVARSSLLSSGKLLYYHIFAWLYSASLNRADVLMANSTWTKSHVDSLLKSSQNTPFSSTLVKTAKIVYPPCDTHGLENFLLEGRQRVIMSLAQFRPEKEHATQLYAMRDLLEMNPEYRNGANEVKLVLLGSSRNDEDAARVESLRQLAKKLGVNESVEFVVNAPWKEVQGWLSRSSIGFSTMIDEHFGINVVEFLAAGLIPVVHASAGPFLDIVVPYQGQPTGFHAKDASEFARKLDEALMLSPSSQLSMRKRGRALASEKFSTEQFVKGWDESWRELDALRSRRR
ncbi:mannosyltransferase [Dacryopinax primogenitus]|uniref:GDP-Man:Man(3)GlcNAc(2)-PP-Dol alpha-1,2-mannosyltransferase n=1 Tax=Dacryopinax primogenitus (strain DJM 731) TaxID=1858805 RepID=M5G4B2_DACPD|nr:mannosyltransferase [Dacryopinax primogenitus]EJU03065.1 mannosyltransferase [Dacryopinax primogenitus]